MDGKGMEVDIPVSEGKENEDEEHSRECTENGDELLSDILQQRQVSEGQVNDVPAKAAGDNTREGGGCDVAVASDETRQEPGQKPLQLPQERLSYAQSTSSIPGAFRIPGMRTSVSDTVVAYSGAMINDDNDDGHHLEEGDSFDDVNEGEQQDLDVEATPPHQGLLSAEVSEAFFRSVSQSMFVTTAVKVPDHDEELAQIEQQVRSRLIEESVEANVVSSLSLPESPGVALQSQAQSLSIETKDDQKNGPIRKTIDKKIRKLLLAFLFFAAVLAFVLGVVFGIKSDVYEDNDNGSVIIDTRRTIDKVRERGVVRCGYYAFGGDPKTSGTVDGFNLVQLNPETGMEEGFNIDQCRAMAVAVFGDPDKVEVFYADAETRFLLLANHSLDMLTDGTTHRMDRDVYVADAGVGFTFSIPYLHLGTAFAGVPDFVDCADNVESFKDHCRYLRVCVYSGTSFESIISDLFPQRVLVRFPDFGALTEMLLDGTCNVIAADRMVLTFFPQMVGYDGPYKIGRNNYSKEPISLVTRDDDAEWSSLVNIVVNLLFLAEAENISKENANDLLDRMSTDGYDAELATAMAAIVAEFGNYGDLYEKHFESFFPRQEINSVYDRTKQTGLIYSIPFGDVEVIGMNPIPGSILDDVLTRGFLRCALQQLHRVGFSEISDDKIWFGLDVEFCRALSGALFAGARDKIVFVELNMTDSFSALTTGDVDVVAGARQTIQADYSEPTTGHGYSFSPAYFYDNEQLGHAYALMVSEEDPQWSAFVFWTVMATMYAEEVGIGQNSSRRMPVTTLFGESLQNMLQDCVSAVGSYGEIYNRTLESHLTRSSANMLYDDLKGPLHYPILFN